MQAVTTIQFAEPDGGRAAVFVLSGNFNRTGNGEGCLKAALLRLNRRLRRLRRRRIRRIVTPKRSDQTPKCSY